MRRPTPDWYAVLGVDPTATADDIARAFRRAMKTCHPDLFPGDPDKEARAKELSGAKAVLGDPKRRAAYDAARARARASAGEGPRERARSAPKTPRTPKMSARPPRPSSRSRLAVEYLGQRRYAGRSWKQTVAKVQREALQAANPGKRLPPLKLVACTVKAPGVVELRFAYGRGARRVVTPPTVARLYWAAPPPASGRSRARRS